MVGASNIVGRPMAMELLNRDGTVQIAHEYGFCCYAGHHGQLHVLEVVLTCLASCAGLPKI